MNITRGDPVVVMGYAGQNGANGAYSFVKSQVVDPVGPFNNPQQLQFADAAQRGNSGGPLLDTSGHVIGVISGKAQLFRKDSRSNVAPTMVAKADIAISLPALKAYLDQQRIRYQGASSGLLHFSDNRLETAAQQFIVQLKCPTSL
jgi:S1-C subfamily serine protease